MVRLAVRDDCRSLEVRPLGHFLSSLEDPVRVYKRSKMKTFKN